MRKNAQRVLLPSSLPNGFLDADPVRVSVNLITFGAHLFTNSLLEPLRQPRTKLVIFRQFGQQAA
jgi:hypothetical protein